jgi:hypothetical protein
MVEMLNAQLPGSWLVTRMGVDPHEIERLRRAGELFAVPGLGMRPSDRRPPPTDGADGGGRLFDLLFEDRSERVVAEVSPRSRIA